MKACVYKVLSMDIYNSFVCNSQNLETMQCQWAGKWINSSVSVQWDTIQKWKECRIDITTTWLNIKITTLSWKNPTKEHITYILFYLKFKKCYLYFLVPHVKNLKYHSVNIKEQHQVNIFLKSPHASGRGRVKEPYIPEHYFLL